MDWNGIFGRRFSFKQSILILMLASLSACGGGDGGTNVSIEDVGGLEGNVTDATTGNIISFATVFVGDRIDVTSNAGTYTFGDLAVGDRAITALRLGYKTFSGTATVSKGVVTAFGIAMTPSNSTDTVSPSVPQNLALSVDVSNNQVTLTWSPSTDDVAVVGYQVYRNNALLAATVNTSFVDADLNVCYQVSAFDEAGNESILSGEVCNGTQDLIPPTVTAPADITVEAESAAGTPSSNAIIAAFLAGSSAVDAVDPSPVLSHNGPGTFPLGATIVTFTYTDAPGNAGSATATVTVVDTTAPAVTAPANITVNAASPAGTPANNAAITAFLAGSRAVDTVDPSPIFSHNAPATFPVGATDITFTYTDASSNVGSAVATVTVVTVPPADTTPPVVTAPADITVEAESTTGTPASNAAIAAFLAASNGVDAIDPSPTFSHNAPGTFPVGATVVTFTYTDATGNPGNATATVTVVDTTAPAVTAPADITVEAESGAGTPASNATIAAFLASSSAVDAVDPSPVLSHNGPGTFPLGATVVTFTYTDATGNSGNAMATVTVVDTAPPTVTAPADITVEAESGAGTPASNAAIAAFLAGSSAVDTVDPSPVFSHNGPGTFPLGSTVVTFTYTDATGNSGNATATVTVVDTTPPTVTAPTDITVEAEKGAGTPASNAAITAFLAGSSAVDAVDPSPAFSHNGLGTFPLGATLVTFTYTDAAGNVGTDNATVTVVDTTPPAVTAPTNIIVEAQNGAGTPASNAAIAAFLAGSSAVDAVDPSPAFSHNGLGTFPLGATLVTFTYTDAAGNVGTDNATVTVVDTTPPGVTAPTDITVEAESGAGTPASNAAIAAFLAGSSAIDAVDPSPAFTGHNGLGTFPLGATLVTFTYTDAAGNVGTDNANVTVVDTTPPTVTAPADIIVEAQNGAGTPASNAAIAAFLAGSSAVDAVDPSPVLSHNGPGTFPLGATLVTFTYTDAAGNVGTNNATVTVVDTTPPTVTAPADIIVEAQNGAGTLASNAAIAAFLAGSSAVDAVDPSPAFTGHNGLGTFPLGTTLVTFTYTDAAGNSGNATATITVVDTTPPTVTAPADIVVGATNSAGEPASNAAIAAFLEGASCVDTVDPSPVISHDGLATFPVGDTIVTFTCTDASGNADNATATVAVKFDIAAPDTTFIVINNNAEIAIVANVLSANLMASDDVGVSDYLITEHNSNDPSNVIPPYLDPLPSDSSWVAITPTTSLDITIPISLTQSYNVGDAVELCAWFMDEAGNVSDRVCDTIIYGEDWETGIGNNWFADNGVWQVGTPTVGPAACFAGAQCAGTVLDGDYPPDTDSRLISATQTLPTVTGAQEVQLRFQNWFSYNLSDSGQVQISVFDPVTSTFGAFVNVGTSVSSISGGWSVKVVDLTPFAGATVRIAFNHTAIDAFGSSTGTDVSSGWYIDDIEILQTTPAFTGDFEAGWADWGADRGVWQVGIATAGPGACLTGTQCAGTVLDGLYPPDTDSRLISATRTLPTVTGAQEVQLRFQNWFSYSLSDSGQVQISVFDSATSTFGAFVDVGTPVSSISGGWSVKVVDLTQFAGATVRIAFNHTAIDAFGSSTGTDVSSGWYIDDIEILQTTPAFTGDFEAGWADWGADRGVWQVGIATAGPGACLTGTQCAGTVLDGLYPPDTDSRLISATRTLPTVTGAQELQLRFQNWFSYNLSDSGQVQISVFDSATSTFGAFVNVGTSVSSISGGWSAKVVDLTPFAGATVRIAFNHTAIDAFGSSTGTDVSSGWYIDDIEILQTTPAFTGDFEAGWADWGADRGVWQVGIATAGPGACLTGTQCAGTVLDGDYPPDTDSRLISATQTLPTVTGAQEVQLRFQNWFSYNLSDSGQVQISVFDPVTSTFGAFVNVGTSVSSISGGWSVKVVDLTPFAGATVRIAFNHTAIDAFGSSTGTDVSSGWYIDDIEILQTTPAFTGDFEAGWADWGADRGVWQVGIATAGPGACLTGTQCAGTVLDGLYPPDTDSRLISATRTLPTVTGAQEVQLRFQNWFSYSLSDSGQVQISVFDSATSTFGAFVDVGTPVSSISGGWSVKVVNLTPFAGATVRIAFNHTAIDAFGSSTGTDVSSGWYIDDIMFIVF